MAQPNTQAWITQQMPLYLLPQFDVRFQSLVVVQWYAIDSKTQVVGLEVLAPEPAKFQSFRACVDFLRSKHVPLDKLQCELSWMAFSVHAFGPVLQYYRQHISKQPIHEIILEMAKKQLDLKQFFSQIQNMKTPLHYCYERLSRKHERVKEIDTYLFHGSMPEAEPMDVEKDVKDHTAVSKNTESDSYFHNIEQRVADGFKNDPPLLKIIDWNGVEHGGYDMQFSCLFQGETLPCWLHYSHIMCNPSYKILLDAYFNEHADIQERIREVSR